MRKKILCVVVSINERGWSLFLHFEQFQCSLWMLSVFTEWTSTMSRIIDFEYIFRIRLIFLRISKNFQNLAGNPSQSNYSHLCAHLSFLKIFLSAFGVLMKKKLLINLQEYWIHLYKVCILNVVCSITCNFIKTNSCIKYNLNQHIKFTLHIVRYKTPAMFSPWTCDGKDFKNNCCLRSF